MLAQRTQALTSVFYFRQGDFLWQMFIVVPIGGALIFFPFALIHLIPHQSIALLCGFWLGIGLPFGFLLAQLLRQMSLDLLAVVAGF